MSGNSDTSEEIITRLRLVEIEMDNGKTSDDKTNSNTICHTNPSGNTIMIYTNPDSCSGIVNRGRSLLPAVRTGAGSPVVRSIRQ